MKGTIEELVEKGRISDTDGKNIVSDFFKTIDTAKEDIESEIEKNKTIRYFSSTKRNGRKIFI